MDNGVSYAKFNGTDRSDLIIEGNWTATRDSSEGSLTVQTSFDDPLTLNLENNTIRIITNDGYEAFWGMVRNITPTTDGRFRNYQIQITDMRGYLNNRPLKYPMKFAKGTTVKTAVEKIISTYCNGDVIGINDLPSDVPCEITIVGTVSSSIKQVLSLCQKKPCYWRTTYYGGKTEHQFLELFGESSGTINYGAAVITGDFHLDMSNLFNVVTVEAKQIPQISPSVQYYFLENKMLTLDVSKGKPMYRIPLKSSPDNTKVFLLVGTQSTDLRTLRKSARISMKVKALDDGTKELLGLNIDDIMPEMEQAFSQRYASQSSVVESGDFMSLIQQGQMKTGQIYKAIQLMFDDELTCYVTKNAIQNKPAFKYGYVLCPTVQELRDKIKALNSQKGTSIDPDNIRGYAITNTILRDYKREFRNDQSVRDHGEHFLQQPITLPNCTDIGSLNLYAQMRLEEMSAERVSGTILYTPWINGEQIGTYYPEPGERLRFEHSIMGNQDDVCVESVQYTIPNPFMMQMSISSNKDPGLGVLPYMILFMQEYYAQKNNLQTLNYGFAVGDTLTVTDSVTITVLDSDEAREWQEQPIEQLTLD